MNNRPLITIGVTAFNAVATIKRAVISALAQTWRPIEMVVVDDASEDSTSAILAKLQGDFSEIRVLYNHSNLGVAASRNRILDAARGDLVAFFDDDDESLPDRVISQYQRITEYERAYGSDLLVVCHTARVQIYPGGASRRLGAMGEHLDQPAPHGLPVANRILCGTPLANGYGAVATCSQMARLSVYRAVGGFDPEFRRSEDTEFAVRLAKAGGHFLGVAEPMVVQEMTPTSDKTLAEERVMMLRLLEKHRDVPDRYGEYEFCQRWLEAKYAYLQGDRPRFAGLMLRLAARHPLRSARRAGLSLPHVLHNRDTQRFHAVQRDDGGLAAPGDNRS